jgi:carboxylesterase
MVQGHRYDLSERHPESLALRQAAIKAGVNEPDNLPFLLSPHGAQTAALLVHGFTATPWEMRLVGEALAEAGIASLAVRLPGHGTSPEELARTCWEDWFAAVEQGLTILEGEFQAVFAVGMSTGCLLLLVKELSRRLKGLILFSPYLEVQHRLAPLAGVLRWLRPYQEKPATEALDSHYYQRRPVAGVHQINRLLRQLRRDLADVTCPLLAFNGEGDRTVDIDSGRRLIELAGSKIRIHFRLGPAVPHVMTREANPCRATVLRQMIQFIQQIESPGGPRRRGNGTMR